MTAEDRMERALRKALYVFAIMIGIAILMVIKAFAQHPPEHQSLHDRFYRGWMMPDNRQVSCCSEKDCAPAQSRLVDGRWQARNSDDEEWVNIPPNKVETERDSPDGRSHLCKLKMIGSTYVYCFLPAAGG